MASTVNAANPNKGLIACYEIDDQPMQEHGFLDCRLINLVDVVYGICALYFFQQVPILVVIEYIPFVYQVLTSQLSWPETFVSMLASSLGVAAYVAIFALRRVSSACGIFVPSIGTCIRKLDQKLINYAESKLDHSQERGRSYYVSQLGLFMRLAKVEAVAIMRGES